MTALVAKRADQLVVGDRILHEHLPSPFFPEPGEVVFVKVHDYRKGRYVFVAYMQDNGFYDSTSYQPDGVVEVYPADTGLTYSRPDEDPQPVAGRTPAHFGAVVDEGGHTAVAVAGGLIEIDPPGLIVGDTAAEQYANAYAAYERDEAEGFILVPHGPVKPPYGSPEREAYDREQALPEDGHVYECCGKVGRISRHESWCEVSRS